MKNFLKAFWTKIELKVAADRDHLEKQKSPISSPTVQKVSFEYSFQNLRI